MLAQVLSKYKSGLSLAFVILFSLGNLIWQSNILARSVSSFGQILDFFTETFHSVGSGLSRLIDSYSSYETLRKERDLLKLEVKLSRELQFRVLELEKENRELRQRLNLPVPPKWKMLEAEVISQDPDNWFRTIIVNKGSEDGIKPYMPVVAYQRRVVEKTLPNGKKEKKEEFIQGVVGKVIQVNPGSARILPILDQYSHLGVRLKKSGHWAQLEGRSPYKDLPDIKYLSLSVFLKPGDEVVTSGGGGIFPKGLLVGYIGKKIERLSSYQQAEVIPAIDFKRLEFVEIILKDKSISADDFPPLTEENVKEP
ncbi:MAG: rod shape-determining protein MreC [Candidatus Hydrogenedentota bacterium]|nr:MAG: rod shape-determining protein MreC [Candidatus Hydrogenedentota bacterium]